MDKTSFIILYITNVMILEDGIIINSSSSSKGFGASLMSVTAKTCRFVAHSDSEVVVKGLLGRPDNVIRFSLQVE